MSQRVTVSVPASSGNIGPGFDVLGLALSLRNELNVRVLKKSPGKPVIHVVGQGELSLPRDRRNVIYQKMEWLFKKANRPVPQLELVCVNRIPLVRGLGSSSAAYLSALLAGNRLLGNLFSRDQILFWASELEGHPDNVAPALLGGVRASALVGNKVISAELPIPKANFVLAVPEFELSTKLARRVLPKKISMKDAVSNLAAVSLLPFAFNNRNGLLKDLLNDKWHEPYRAKLIPGFHQVKKAALHAGALGMTLSGAGPTLLSFVEFSAINKVAKAMQAAFSQAGVRSRILQLSIDKRGAVVK